ncbi:MAG: RNA polymerase sigma factor, partial [Saprospiraceae bacterium]
MEQLITACRRGDNSAQRNLYDRFKTPLFGVCLRYARDRPEAQDMLQEAFLAIFRDIGQYNGSGPLEGWMRRVTVRCALQYLRRKNPLRFAED